MEKLTKVELLSFIEFLKEREITIVPCTHTHFSLFNGRNTCDVTETVRRLSAYVKWHTAEESYKQGPAILSDVPYCSVSLNCNQRFMPEIVYAEDLRGCLSGLIADEKELDRMFAVINSGSYKRLYRDKKYPLFSDDLNMWAKANHQPLISRSIWAERFCFDYEFWLDIHRHRCMPKDIAIARKKPNESDGCCSVIYHINLR